MITQTGLEIVRPYQMLEELRDKTGLLSIIKVTNGAIMFTCPYHSGGMERRPSCGLIIEEKDSIKSGMVHCFTCHKTVTIEQMVSDLLGYNDIGVAGRRWLQRFAIYDEANLEDNVEEPVFQYNEKSNDDYGDRVYHPYMEYRKISPLVAKKFDLRFNKDKKTIVFPVRDFDTDEILFATERSIQRKNFYIPYGIQKPCYGLYELKTALLNGEKIDSIYLVESQINCLTLWSWGYYSLALFGTGTNYQYQQLLKLPVKEIILAFDGDEAGRKGENKVQNFLQNKRMVSVIHIPDGKDINDLTLDEFKKLKIE